ncbi:MAG: hypothetical protein H0U51_10825 [Propionibacteriales bacterium]|jgi:hypothetical protein|nr:hypothetical protein [Propionibacteriales bacterium]
MGEAKRRKLTGDGPKSTAAMVTAEDFIVPDDDLAITVDVVGTDPFVTLFPLSKLAPLLELMDAEPDEVSYDEQVQAVVHGARAKRQADGLPPPWVAMAALWTAMSNPLAPQYRRIVSTRIRKGRPVHITWRHSPEGLAVVVDDQFRDLEAIARVAPPGRIWVYGPPADAELGH